MKNSSKLASALLLATGSWFLACKPATKTTTGGDKTSTTSNTPKPTESDSTEPAPNINSLGSMGAKTGSVKEANSGMTQALPFDASVRTGVLSNGMRYYIRQNSKPEKRVELRLAVNAGAMQEEDNQRGLAHFVEHMAFNGTANFKKNKLVGFLENTGVRFGADLNAYTSFDETVYMLQLPTDKPGLVDTGLMVMSDWATGVSFEGEEIDKERGVIESEWRTRLGAGERMRQVYWPKLFYNSRYANRLPIGTMEVIKGAPHERLTTFYKDWYRPNLMALVVVGDLDVDAIEKKIKEQFSKLQNPATSRTKELYPVPDHAETFVAIATDKEATGSEVEFLIKHNPTETKTLQDFRTTLLHQLYNAMLNDRFDELSKAKDAPFVGAYASYFGWVRSKDAYNASATAKEGMILESLRSLLVEHERVVRFGFTQTELDRQKLALEKRVERQYNERDKTQSGQLAMQCVYHFLDNQPLMGIEQQLSLTRDFLKGIRLEEINELAKKWLTEQNRAVIVTAPEKPNVKVPTEAEIRQVLAEAKNIKVEAYVDKFTDQPLLEKLPTAGKVISKKETPELGLTELKLSNGVRVLLKPTKFQNDQILLSGYSVGGTSLYSDADFFAAFNASSIIDEAGVGAFDNIALEKKLTGKNISISPYISEMYEGFSGNSTVEDFETMLQLTYLYATQPRKDKDAFDRYVAQNKEQLKNLLQNPMYYFYDQMEKTQSTNHPRRFVIPSLESFDKINYDRAFQIYQERFSDFSDFTFAFVGNFDVAKITPMIEQYLGSLPSKNRVENWKDVGVKIPAKGVNNALKKGIAPQANVCVSFLTEAPWSREEDYRLNSMNRVLNIMVRENLREDKGGVYSPQVYASFTRDPKGLAEVGVIFQCAPDNVDNLVNAVKEEIKKLQKDGVSDDNFNKIREIQRRERESNLERNNFWLGALTTSYQRNMDPMLILKYNELVEKLTKEDIKKAANTYINLDKAVIISVTPEKTE